ncbi:DUF1501 domain-containing protein [Brevifollis gellanilyticus]|uniref:Tat pathway signal protein n=1 Tax=Brevifollis gellanilyticus TaxID=748831 RepID=A0A512M2S1_9BACT|nr:DUF1501 domain-containing protein [Brevifollis gellanilyticus]GEP41032.1 Tat pathway signal protein [Brevifollis gellanilyticus]
MITFSQSRRHFLGRASCAAVSSIPVLNTVLNLSLAEKISAVTAPANGEYRALVCLFLSGGNDSYNMLVPREATAYSQYQTSRSNLALAPGSLIDIQPTGLPNFAVHNAMPQVATLFQNSKAAFVANVGTLIERVQNRTQVNTLQKQLPLGLYSHSDQVEQWQTSLPHQRSGIGWAGRAADILQELNSNQKVPMNISLDGGNVWQTGHDVAEYAITTDGAVALENYEFAWQSSDVAAQAFSQGVDSQLAQQYSNVLMQTFNGRKRAALDAYNAFTTATAASLPGAISFPDTYVGNRLEMIAKAIQGHGHLALGAKRQTFFVNFGGWDHHSGVLSYQNSMLPQVSQAIGAFYNQLVAMGMENNVTLFTASDFGRTLTSNGQGSDHAWGGNQLVVGGSVLGKKIYGQYPSLALNPDIGSEVNPLDLGSGRLIPTTSCDEYFAELALWLGVSPTDLPLVFPNISHFYTPGSASGPVGFMA